MSEQDDRADAKQCPMGAQNALERQSWQGEFLPRLRV
jgi:hypothetical protein